MKKMKKFLIYALLVVALWIFSDIVIYLTINGTYNPINTKVEVSSPQIIIEDSRATYVNGKIKGKIVNNTQEKINDLYLKIDMYSARDVNLGTKYVKINDLSKGATQEFEMGYKFTDVDYVIVTTSDDVKDVTEEEFMSDEMSFYFLIGTLMFLYLI